MRTCCFSSVSTSVPDLDPVGSDILMGYLDPAKGFPVPDPVCNATLAMFIKFSQKKL
jgi:hypothetical protein